MGVKVRDTARPSVRLSGGGGVKRALPFRVEAWRMVGTPLEGLPGLGRLRADRTQTLYQAPHSVAASMS